MGVPTPSRLLPLRPILTLLGGAFVGQGEDRAKEVAAAWPAARMGSLVIVMDLGLFAPAEAVRHGVDELVRLGMEQMIPLRGYDEVTESSWESRSSLISTAPKAVRAYESKFPIVPGEKTRKKRQRKQ